jgi:hypothetical protein
MREQEMLPRPQDVLVHVLKLLGTSDRNQISMAGSKRLKKELSKSQATRNILLVGDLEIFKHEVQGTAA